VWHAVAKRRARLSSRQHHQGLIDILGFQVWVSLQDLVTRSAGCEQPDDRADRDPQTAYARFPAHHGRIKRNAT